MVKKKISFFYGEKHWDKSFSKTFNLLFQLPIMKKLHISILISSTRTYSGTRRLIGVRNPRVSPGALPLTKHPEDSEYDMH